MPTIRPLAPKPKLINNRYELIEKLGEGGMGSVYRTLDKLQNEIVALKHMRIKKSTAPPSNKTLATAEANRFAITTEFKALASLHHPNIVSVLDYGWDEEQTPYFTMTYLENTQTILEASRTASIEQRLDYFVQLMQALMYVHRRGIVHRDLKPDNILVTTDNRVKILDFGIAVHENDSQQGMLGTMLYMPPELIQKNTEIQVSRSIDMYTAGLVAYEMFTGQYPYNKQDMKSLLRDILKKTPDLSLIGKEASGKAKPNTRLPLQTIIGRLTAKDPNFRYYDAADVLEDLAPIVGTTAIEGNTEIRESFLQAASFVGREKERDILLSGLQDLIHNKQGSSFLIGGESGVGKSRLIEEIRIQALVQGMTVLRGQAVNHGGLPYHALRDIVRRLVLSTDISDKHASILSQLVPDIATVLQRPLPPVPKLDGDATRKRLISAVVKLFTRQENPLVLILEDLHWMGRDSLDILGLLNHHIDQLPFMIIGSYRDDEMLTLPEQLQPMHLLKLNRLSAEEIAELSESMLGKVGKQPHLVDMLHRETEGNVFFLVEVVRVLVAEAGSLDDVGRMTLPERVFAGGIEQVIQHRLDQIINPQSHELLKIAAVFGRYINLAVMSQLAKPFDRSLDDWLHDCNAAAVLEIYDGIWRFTHDKLRDHILANLTTDEWIYHNELIARTIESLYEDEEGWAETLTRLWHHAENLDKELKYMARQVEHLSQFSDDYGQIQDLANYALTKLPDDDGRRVDFLNPLSRMYWKEGEYKLGYDYAMQANELAKSHGYDAGLAQSYHNLGNTAFYLGYHQTALVYYRHSADIYKELGDTWHHALNLQNIGWAHVYVDNYEKAWDFTEEGQAIFIELNEMWGIANGYYIMALIAAHEGDYEDAELFHYRSLELNEQYEDAWNKGLNYCNLAFVLLTLKRMEDAQRILKLALQISYEMSFKGMMLEGLVGVAQVYLHEDQPERAATLVGMIMVQSAMNNDVHMRLHPVISALESIFPEDQLQQMMEQGQTLDVMAFVRKYLQPTNPSHQ